MSAPVLAPGLVTSSKHAESAHAAYDGQANRQDDSKPGDIGSEHFAGESVV